MSYNRHVAAAIGQIYMEFCYSSVLMEEGNITQRGCVIVRATCRLRGEYFTTRYRAMHAIHLTVAGALCAKTFFADRTRNLRSYPNFSCIRCVMFKVIRYMAI